MKRINRTRASVFRLIMRIILLSYILFIGASAGSAWFCTVRTKEYQDTQGKVVSVIQKIVGKMGPTRFPERTIYMYEIKVEYTVSGNILVGCPAQYNVYYPYYVGEQVAVLYDPTNAAIFELKSSKCPISFPNIILFIGLIVIYIPVEIQMHRMKMREKAGGMIRRKDRANG